ncbi:MAG: ComEA family DNA-binding protein [Janthinobacterium lividum]
MHVVPPPPRLPRTTWGKSAAWRWLRRYFSFSRAENHGFVGLLAVTLAAAWLPALLRPADPVYLPAADQHQLNQWATGLTERLDSVQETRYRSPGSRYPARPAAGKVAPHYASVPQVKLTPFDPNALSAEGWEARGVPHFVAGRLVKYGQAAGGFQSKAQIKRTYGLPDSVYQRLEPFLQLPAEPPGHHSPSYASRSGAGAPLPGHLPRKPAHLQPFDLNLADTTQLMQVKGIGRGRANGLLRQREKLGGFVSEAQLSDFFMLRDAPDLVDSLRKYTFVAPGFQPKGLNINTATFDELWPHPCVGKPLARLIVAFRAQHGPFATPEDLRQLKLLKPEQLAKLLPYVRCK